MSEKINKRKVAQYWKEGASQSITTAKYLHKGKRYSDCLFFCHLSIEKILKGLIVAQTGEHALYIHELDRLALETNLDFTDKQLENLKIITTFNIQARYDSIKLSFHKKCNANYAKEYLEITHQLYLWLKEKFPKK